MTASRGVYFLADDGVLDLSLAFLASFRAYNPKLSLTLVPFSGQIGKLRGLAPQFDFTVLDCESAFARCDRISIEVLGRNNGTFRKLACWSGIYEEFIYIDVDTIVQSEVLWAYGLLSSYDYIASHSNLVEIKRWVWESGGAVDSAVGCDTEYSANTGFFCSRRADWFEVLTSSATRELVAALRSRLCWSVGEQSFLNVAVTSSGMRYTSLTLLKRACGSPDIRLEQWAGSRGGVINGGRISFRGRPPVLLLHWAGRWQPPAMERRLRRLFARWFPRSRQLCVKWRMPYRGLWMHYYHIGSARMRLPSIMRT